MNDSSISTILGHLLFEKQMKPMDLARATNVPQPNIQRLLAGTTARPHISTLEPIAKYFSISIEQLKGKEPIHWLKLPHQQNKITNIPIIKWHLIDSWLESTPKRENHFLTEDSLLIDIPANENMFALVLEDESMEPVFSLGTLLVIDPEREVKDRCYVIVKLHEQDGFVLRQLIIDAQDKYIRPLAPSLMQVGLKKLTPNDKICGILIQARRDFG